MLRKLARIIAGAAVALAAGYAAYLGWRVAQERRHAPRAVQAILGEIDPTIDAIPGHRIGMLLRVEDPTFWSNNGIDLATPGAGLTTVSQGLGKRIFFERYTPGLAKLELMALTRFALNGVVAKRDILRAFLATAYLGESPAGPVNGFPEGARRWFGKELGELDDREFLGLVAMLPAPNMLDPVRHPRENAERVRRLEKLLAGACAPAGLTDVDLEACAD
ncbi:MAG: transglycosylase domain-containing protein [Acidobacteria bacterium]|nr:transglycosylase domain-containing protein [Acidobacteriota bacterium]